MGRTCSITEAIMMGIGRYTAAGAEKV